MMRVLVVEDDTAIVASLANLLRSEGYEVEHTGRQDRAIELLDESKFDLALVDIALEQGNGFAVCAAAKNAMSSGAADSPAVIFLTASDDEFSTVAGLDMGADDYIAKPFGTAELMARIRTSLRHSHSATPERAYRADGLEIYFDKRQIFLNGTEIHLTQIEYQLLALLAESSGKVMTYKSIINMIWGPYADTDNQILRVNMANIRRKIESNPARPKYIFTEVGIGYRMLESSSLQSSPADKAP